MRMCSSRVVFPDPRKPERRVTGRRESDEDEAGDGSRMGMSGEEGLEVGREQVDQILVGVVGGSTTVVRVISRVLCRGPHWSGCRSGDDGGGRAVALSKRT